MIAVALLLGIGAVPWLSPVAVQQGGYREVSANSFPSGQRIMVLVPSSYSDSVGAPLIIYHHGVGEDERALLKDRLKGECVKALLKAGYILAGSNAHGNNWGCREALDSYVELYRYLISHYRIERTSFWSQSMGGMSGLLALRDKRIPNVIGWLGTYPVTNLKSSYGMKRFAEQIQASFHFSESSEFGERTTGFDPVQLSPESFKVQRVRIYASTQDTVVPKVDHTDVLARILAKGRREFEVVTCRGEHGDPSHFNPAEYVAFFDRCHP